MIDYNNGKYGLVLSLELEPEIEGDRPLEFEDFLMEGEDVTRSTIYTVECATSYDEDYIKGLYDDARTVIKHNPELLRMMARLIRATRQQTLPGVENDL